MSVDYFRYIIHRLNILSKNSEIIYFGSKKRTDLLHPFDEFNIHPEIAKATKKLFDNGHYSQATFEAFKVLEYKIKKICKEKYNKGLDKFYGVNLINKILDENNPIIKINNYSGEYDEKFHAGIKSIVIGAFSAFRNERGHVPGVNINEDLYDCIHNIALASNILRLIEKSTV